MIVAKRLDEILVIDVEATRWEGKAPDGQMNDIIEVGLTLVNVQTFELSGKRSILVRPDRSTVSPFCTSLTTITQEMVDEQGVSFAEACKILRKEYDSRDRLWASWGDYDRRQFERECRERGVGYPFGVSHMNVKTLFAILHGHTRETGARHAVESLGYTFEGTHHRGHDDAWNIATTLSHLLKTHRAVI